MTAAGNKVQDHYASEGIAARILAALRAAGGSEAGPITPDALAPLDHFHGRGLKATKETVALLEPLSGERILDIGGGIGGPARWTATHFGCHVTSLDLTPEFCRAAEELNAATGLSDRVRVVEGSATDLPFEDDGFDRAYSENVAMNIDDKRRFYAEALRVLRPGAVFAFSHYGAGPKGEPDYPLPWAAGPGTSFLCSPGDTGASSHRGVRDRDLPGQDGGGPAGLAGEPPAVGGTRAAAAGAADAHGRADWGISDQRGPECGRGPFERT